MTHVSARYGNASGSQPWRPHIFLEWTLGLILCEACLKTICRSEVSICPSINIMCILAIMYETHVILKKALNRPKCRQKGVSFVCNNRGGCRIVWKGGLEIKKSRALSHALFNYRISFIASPGLLFFSSYCEWEATIGGGLLNEGAFILRSCRVAQNFSGT